MKHQVIKWLNVFSVVFLIAALAVSFVVFTATQGAIASWDGSIDSTFASGSGSESDPYVIETEQQLGLLLANLSSGVNFEGLHLRLDSDLDMTGAT